MTETEWTPPGDPILDEVHRIRAEVSLPFDGNVRKLMADLRREEQSQLSAAGRSSIQRAETTPPTSPPSASPLR